MYALKYLFYASIYIKLIVVGLVVMLGLVIAMGLSKYKKLAYIGSYIKSFEKQFWSGIDLTQFFEANKEQNLNHPLGMIFKAVFEEWQASESLRGMAMAKADIKERMLNVAHKQKVLILQTCERYVDTLVAIIRIAPFLGSLGTILGMMDVFYNIDLENGLTINDASVGIGSSLVCMVFSLVVAILSMVMFWFFNMKIQSISDQVDGFIVDLLHILGRGLDGTAVNGSPAPSATAGSQTMQQQVKSAPAEAKPASSTTSSESSSSSVFDDDI